VEVHGLTKRFGDIDAVAGLDLQMERGHVLAMLGPNGAGKTTTVEICEGFQRPDGGHVRILGLDPAAQGDGVRPRIGVMPQGGGAYPMVRAGEMLQLIAACAAHPLDTRWLLDILGLASARRTPYKRLSGGQQQRLSLACAVISRPELVFLDEPTAGMDPQARRLVWDLINALRRDGVSVLLTTHLMEEAETLSDRVVIIDHGRTVASGAPADLTASSGGGQSLYFRTRSGLELTPLIAALPPGYQASETQSGEYVVQGTIEPHIVSTVTAWCAQHNVLAQGLWIDRRNLEDVFLELTGRDLR
jgi:ABC-2 type transport system ATP-binding protein